MLDYLQIIFCFNIFQTIGINKHVSVKCKVMTNELCFSFDEISTRDCFNKIKHFMMTKIKKLCPG